MLIINADDPLSMLLGSKNPQISLKLAEIRTDQNGKVGTCAQAHFFFLYAWLKGFIMIYYSFCRLLAHKTRSLLSHSQHSFLGLSTLRELDGQKMENCK